MSEVNNCTSCVDGKCTRTEVNTIIKISNPQIKGHVACQLGNWYRCAYHVVRQAGITLLGG